MRSLLFTCFRDRRQITLEFLDGLCMPKGVGVKANLLRKGKLLTKNLYHQTTKNPTKVSLT